ncbi:hypothetical protein ACLH0K_06550 [Arthrobacter sp. MPF02]|uniref:hypothetical protein n=1 Tax=Arthrobacter sp. MPF02 TaxID=3388492 RepID=UPI003984968F
MGNPATLSQAPQAAPPQSHERAAAAAVRLFVGFAAFGAGAVNLAISSSFLAGAAGAPGSTEYTAAVLAGLWGAGLTTAAVLHFARGNVPFRGPVRAALMAAAVVHVAAVVLSTPATSKLALSHLAALLLTLMITAAAAWLRRSGDRKGGAPPPQQPGRLLLAAFAGAVLVAGITTPGLAASSAGEWAVPHGGHGIPSLPGDHHQR